MKKAILLLLAFIAAAAPAAPDMAIVKQNNDKLNRLRNELNGYRQGPSTRTTYQKSNPGGKDWPRIAEIENEALQLLDLKENAPDSVGKSTIHRVVAVAYSSPIHLRHTADAEREFELARKSAKTPDDQALVRFDYADFKYREAKDDGKKWAAEKRAAYDMPGVTPPAKLAMLNVGIDGLDFEKDGWKAVEGHPEFYKEYFLDVLRWDHNPWVHEIDSLDIRGDAEHMLEIAEKAVEVCPDNCKDEFRGKRRNYLAKLGRFDEVERELMMDVAAAEKPNRRCGAYAALADFYAGRARRYYAPPDESFVKKCFRAFEQAVECDPQNGGVIRRCIDLAMEFKRHDVAKPLLDKYAGDKPDERYAGYLGDIAYYAGDYETAAKWYLSHPKMQQGEREPPNRYDRVVGALYALGRYEEAIKHAENIASWVTWKAYRADLIATLKARIAETSTK